MTTAILLAAVLLLFSTSIHYATLRAVSAAIAARPDARYFGMLLSVGAITLAHVVEASLYAGGFWLGDDVFMIGSFKVEDEMGWMDYFYFSLVNFTTLGRGDIAPTDHQRFIAGIEAFNGFLLITASGSFILQVMRGKAPLSREW